MHPGDVLECINQAMGPADMYFTTELPLVKNVAQIIAQTYSAELKSANGLQKNYFILIAHSQGNFFAEGIAYQLSKTQPKIFHQRLGVLSLGSPTSYTTLNSDFRSRRVKHFTRRDDAINALRGLDNLGKTPWPRPDRPGLWPWKESILQSKLRLTEWSWLSPLVVKSPLIEEMGLGLPPGSRCNCPDDALYTPLMNSHLLDNYLTDPTATKEGILINPKAARDIGLSSDRSPRAQSVLGSVRFGLFELKRELLSH